MNRPRYSAYTYELVAKIIRESRPVFPDEHTVITALLVHLSSRFSAEFQKDNKAFKPEKFAEACFPISAKEH